MRAQKVLPPPPAKWAPQKSQPSPKIYQPSPPIVDDHSLIWSNVLMSVTWVELLLAVYKFFRINNIDLKCSFVRCRKYHKSWNGAAELHISVELLCGTTAAELHNFVVLLCGTKDESWTLWKIQETQIDSRPPANFWKMYALRRFSKLLKDERFTKTE